MNNIELRAVEPADIDFLYRIENDPCMWKVSLGSAPISRHMLWKYARQYTADIYAEGQLRLIVTCDGEAAGVVDITDFDARNARAMLGVAVAPALRRRGIARAALTKTIEMCRQVYSLHQLAVLVPRDNEASMALFEGLGFRTSGCLRSWLRRADTFTDVVVMQLMLDSFTKD